MEEKFASLEELYSRLKPALRTKKNEMIRQKLPRMEEKEIWLYFCKHVWRGKSSLTLGEMVSDILNTDSYEIMKERVAHESNYSQ